MLFEELGLGPDILKAVADAGYVDPTPIQAQAIPTVLQGHDVLGCAQTGTGKTASFTLPMIEVLSNGRARARMPRSLILTPTRELAAQISQNFITYGKYHKLTMALLIGGVSTEEQQRRLTRGVDVLIATPGRLIDLFERGSLLLNDVKFLVVDEADRMLDMGFIPDVEKIVGLLPKTRQTMMFSATLLPEIHRLAGKFLLSPKEITVTPPATTSETVKEYLVKVTQRDKNKALRFLLNHEKIENALIFCNRKKDVDLLNSSLRRHMFSSAPLHGDMAQSTREETLAAFKTGEIKLLVATDVAGRGLDIQGLSHVFNFDVPLHAEDYVHRIGRTARAGKTGCAFMLVTLAEAKYITAITELIGHNISHHNIQNIEVQDSTEPSKSKAKTKTKPPQQRSRSNKAVNKSAPIERAESKKYPTDPSGNRQKTKSFIEKQEQSKTVEAPSETDAIKRSQKINPRAPGWGDHVPDFIQVRNRASN